MKIFMHKDRFEFTLITGFKIDEELEQINASSPWYYEYYPSYGLYFHAITECSRGVISGGDLATNYDEIGDL